MADSDDESMTLSPFALEALAQFHAEKEAHRHKFEKLQAEAEEVEDEPLSMELFGEDWNESQFWYSDETATTLADQLLDGATPHTTIGVLSTPTAFVALKNRLRQWTPDKRPKLVLFEHDNRFDVFKEFVYYDFQQPLKLPVELKGSVDRIIIDPPFLSNDCQTKFALTARWLLKPQQPKNQTRIVVCTAGSIEPMVTKLYQFLGVRTTTFEPQHKGSLSNNYFCYANFEAPAWSWRSKLQT